MKKGQIEIMGLVIIVALLVFILIFALSFLIKPKQENEDILKLKANSLRSSLLKTSLCEDFTIRDELEKCSNNIPLECFNNCNELKQEIVKIIERSLEKEKYYFKSGNIELGFCEEKITSVPQYIGEGFVELAICR